MCMFLYCRTIYSSLDIYPLIGLPSQMESLFLDPWEIVTLSSIMVELIYTPTNCIRMFLFLHILSSICCLQIFNDSHSILYDLVSQCGFDLHFPNDQWWWAFFHMLLGLIYVSFWKVSVYILQPLLNGVVFFPCISVLVLCRFWILALCQIGRLQKCFPILFIASSL